MNFDFVFGCGQRPRQALLIPEALRSGAKSKAKTVNVSLRTKTFCSGVTIALAVFCFFCCQSVSAQQPPKQHAKPKSKTDKKKQKRGILGVVPTLGVVDARNAPPLDASEKLHLAVTEFANPVLVLEDAVKAQYYRATDPRKKIGYGAVGYAKQFGAAYLDTVSGSMISTFLYPALLHQDPRYFRDGRGSIRNRLVYSVSRVFLTRGDNGQGEFNWSQILGSSTSSLLSSTYYPVRARGVGLTTANIGWSLLGDAGTNVFNEFWPDFSRWLSNKWSRGGGN